jgi:hypothetical protein
MDINISVLIIICFIALILLLNYKNNNIPSLYGGKFSLKKMCTKIELPPKKVTKKQKIIKKYCETPKKSAISKHKYLGCFADDSKRILPKLNKNLRLTPQMCGDVCKKQGYKYAGVQFGRECWCGNGERGLGNKLAEKECNMKCIGDNKKTCGGFVKQNIYQVSDKSTKKKPKCDNWKTIVSNFSTSTSGGKTLDVPEMKTNKYDLEVKFTLNSDVGKDYQLLLVGGDGHKRRTPGVWLINNSIHFTASTTASVNDTPKSCWAFSKLTKGKTYVFLLKMRKTKTYFYIDGKLATTCNLRGTLKPQSDLRIGSATTWKTADANIHYIKVRTSDKASCSKGLKQVCNPPKWKSLLKDFSTSDRAGKVINVEEMKKKKYDIELKFTLKENVGSNFELIFVGGDGGHKRTPGVWLRNNTIHFASTTTAKWNDIPKNCWSFSKLVKGRTYVFLVKIRKDKTYFHVDGKLINTCALSGTVKPFSTLRVGNTVTGFKAVNMYIHYLKVRKEGCDPFPKYLGCHNDTRDRLLKGRFVSDAKMTPKKCNNICKTGGFKYAGVQYGKMCFCGNGEKGLGQKVSESECGMTCAGDKNKTCGGVWKQNIYQVGDLAIKQPATPKAKKAYTCPARTVSIKSNNKYLESKKPVGDAHVTVSSAVNKNCCYDIVPPVFNKQKNNRISIESSVYPGHYIRHQNYIVKLHKPTIVHRFRQDFEWIVKLIRVVNSKQILVEIHPAEKQYRYLSLSVQGGGFRIVRNNTQVYISGDEHSIKNLINKYKMKPAPRRAVTPKPKPKPKPSPTITIYEHGNYRGLSKKLGLGDHSMYDFKPVKNDMISSIRIPAGLVVKAYKHGIGSEHRTYTSDVPFTKGFNDAISAINVSRR